MLKTKLLWILRVLIFCATVLFLVRYIDFRLVLNAIRRIPVWILLIIIPISLWRIWLNGIRWKLCSTDSLRQLSDWDYFRYMMISTTFNQVMPGVLGGDFVKAVYIGSEVQANKARNVLSVLFDRIVGFTSILLLGLLAVAFSPLIDARIKHKVFIFAFAGLLLFLLLVWLLRRLGASASRPAIGAGKTKLGRMIRDGWLLAMDIVGYFLTRPFIFIKALLLSFIIHISWFFVNYYLALHLQINVTFFDISMVSCLVWIITIIPISIGGMGVRELSYIGLLSGYGVSAEQATALSVTVFSTMVIVAILGVPFIFTKKEAIKI
ncbi:flippase-like domain-containing protein [bacterium]|nr:flippase-like domain-containing protein [bacterium]